MSTARSPVEQRIELLSRLWIEATDDPRLRLLVWRVPGNAERMLTAFFEAHRQAETALTPDCMLLLDGAFETGFGYSRELLEALHTGYVASCSDLNQQGVGAGWRGAHAEYPESAAGVLRMFGSFADHHRAHMRHFVPVLMPSTVTSAEALQRWLEAALQAPVPERVRLAVVDYTETRQWQVLADRHPDQVRVIDAPIDMFDIARATAAQAGGGGGGGAGAAYRQLLADIMLLLEKGSAAQTARRADKALVIAEREQWPDQQVVLHMMAAGAHLKEKQPEQAIGRYRRARDAALLAEAAGHPAGGNLVMQTWFGEAGAWLTDGKFRQAAHAYAQAAEAARRVPNAMFVIEGLRMAGFCEARDRRRDAAREYYRQAIVEARTMDPAERRSTTLPLLLQDMLRLQDAARVLQLEKAATDYQARIADAHAQAESRATRLGAEPRPTQLQRIEAEMVASFEAAFARAAEVRERVIAGGDEYFRKVVALGREFLHAQWNGLPDIRHPLDSEPEQWSKPPQFVRLPDPADLLQPEAGRAPAVEACT